MAAGFILIPKINQLLDDLNPDGQELVREAVGQATSVRDAAERGNLLDGLTEELAAEARAVFDALPSEVDQEILDTLRSALDQGVPITFEWQETREIGVKVSHHPSSGAVHIVLETPDGREFLPS